jgi:hypothetical protein
MISSAKKILLIFYFMPWLISCQEQESNLSPGPFTVVVNNISKTSAEIRWSASIDPEGQSVTYELFLNDQSIASNLTSLNYTALALSETEYNGRIVASDLSGNKTTVNFNFTIKNLPPGEFEVRSLKVQQTAAFLHWSNSIDPEGDSVKYALYLNDLLIEPETNDTYYTLANLTPDTEYSGEVIATDSLKNATKAAFQFRTDSVRTIFVGNIDLSSQTSVNEFAKKHYKEIRGNVHIGGFCFGPQGDVSCYRAVKDISALLGLKKITGMLTIEWDSLQNFHGLDSLTETGRLSMGTFLAQDFSGFGKLRTVNGPLLIDGRQSSMAGFENLTHIKGGFALSAYDIVDMHGLENLRNIDGGIRIRYNRYLESLKGLENLEAINGDLQLSENISLTDFCVLSNLVMKGQVKGKILIRGNKFNPTLADLQAGNCKQ